MRDKSQGGIWMKKKETENRMVKIFSSMLLAVFIAAVLPQNILPVFAEELEETAKCKITVK